MDRLRCTEEISTSVSSLTVFTTGTSASLLSFVLPHVLIRPLCLCLDLWPRCCESRLRAVAPSNLAVRPHLSKPLHHHHPTPPPLKYIGTLSYDYAKALQHFYKIKHQIARHPALEKSHGISALCQILSCHSCLKTESS